MSRQPRAMADINVTPLIDVLLVLLIVFMVAVPATTRVLEVSVPAEGEPPRPGTAPPPPLPTLQIHAQDFELGRDRHATLASLERGLVSFYETRRDRRLIVRPDDDVDYGRVIAAMDAARGAGVDRIGIAGALPAISTAPTSTAPSPR